MKITSREHKHVMDYVSKFPRTERRFKVSERWEFSGLPSKGYELTKLDESTLRHLVAFLPSGRLQHVASPFLHSVRQKGKASFKHLARPHTDPDHWPKSFRKINNNGRAGLRDFGGGQFGVLNDKAMSVPLRGRFIWNEKKFGELIILGPWTDIASAIGKAGGGLSWLS